MGERVKWGILLWLSLLFGPCLTGSAAENYFEILGVTSNATDLEIKEAYRRKAVKFHPTVNPLAGKESTDKFKAIQEAYDVLSDPERKRRYLNYGLGSSSGGALKEIFATHDQSLGEVMHRRAPNLFAENFDFQSETEWKKVYPDLLSDPRLLGEFLIFNHRSPPFITFSQKTNRDLQKAQDVLMTVIKNSHESLGSRAALSPLDFEKTLARAIQSEEWGDARQAIRVVERLELVAEPIQEALWQKSEPAFIKDSWALPELLENAHSALFGMKEYSPGTVQRILSFLKDPTHSDDQKWSLFVDGVLPLHRSLEQDRAKFKMMENPAYLASWLNVMRTSSVPNLSSELALFFLANQIETTEARSLLVEELTKRAGNKKAHLAFEVLKAEPHNSHARKV